MKTTNIVSCIVMLGLASVPVLADKLDTAKPFLCAAVDVYQCIDGGSCEAVTSESIGAPDYMRIDLKRKLLFAAADEAPSAIEHIEDVESRVVIQGIEDGEKTGDGTGWTISVDKSTARFVVMAAGIEAGFIIFGACTSL